MMAGAKRLQAALPKQQLIASMRDDMINNRGGFHSALGQAITTKGFFFQLRKPEPFPTSGLISGISHGRDLSINKSAGGDLGLAINKSAGGDLDL